MKNNKIFNYKDKLEREKQVYEKNLSVKQNLLIKILHSSLVLSKKRSEFNYNIAKLQMMEVEQQYFKNKINKMLIAPCGTGSDYKYFSNFVAEIHGIDISPIAVKQCPSLMQIKVRDILDSGYPKDTFDLVASPFFFHHVLKVGFTPYLKEFYRILKKDGMLVILEPSIW